jgi:hypothetical protein
MDTNNLSNKEINIDSCKLQKMVFIYNSLHDGWNVKKRGDNYIFSKKHQGKKEILDDNYLTSFIQQNSKIKIKLE